MLLGSVSYHDLIEPYSPRSQPREARKVNFENANIEMLKTKPISVLAKRYGPSVRCCDPTIRPRLYSLPCRPLLPSPPFACFAFFKTSPGNNCPLILLSQRLLSCSVKPLSVQRYRMDHRLVYPYLLRCQFGKRFLLQADPVERELNIRHGENVSDDFPVHLFGPCDALDARFPFLLGRFLGIRLLLDVRCGVTSRFGHSEVVWQEKVGEQERLVEEPMWIRIAYEEIRMSRGV